MSNQSNTQAVCQQSIDFFSTPYSNTGLLGLIAESSEYNGVDVVIPRLDWLMGVAKISQDSFQSLLDFISVNFFTSWSDPLGYNFSGRAFANRVVSDTGAIIRYNYLTDDLENPMMDVHITINAGTLTHADYDFKNWYLVQHLERIGFRATRIDIAADDFGKKHHYSAFASAIAQGHNYGFRKHRLVESFSSGVSDGWTFYMGKRSGNKMYRYYDKSAETGGVIDSYRLEGEFKDEFACNIFKHLNLSFVDSPKVYSQMLSAILFGCIDFRLAKKEFGSEFKCDFWRDMILRSSSEPFKVPSGTHRTKLDDSILWVEKAVARTLATIRIFLEKCNHSFPKWLEAVLSAGSQRINSQHISQVEGAYLSLSRGALTYAESLDGVF